MGPKKNYLVFWDENFFVDRERAKNIICQMLAEKINIPWNTSTRADYFNKNHLDDELLSLMEKTNCDALSIGAESGSPKILKKIKKEVTPEEIINSAKQCLAYDIDPIYSFMAGLPGEDWTDTKKTLRLIDVLTKLRGRGRVKIIGPQTFRPYPGSPLFKECVAYGWKTPSSLKEWSRSMSGELNYLEPKQFPWLKHPLVIEALDVYVRLGANPLRHAWQLEVGANKILKFAFLAVCRLRWKLKFFWWPIEYLLAKKFLASSQVKQAQSQD